MPLEDNPQTIADLREDWPTGGDVTSEGDDHFRNVKQVLKRQFPGELGNGLDTPITASETDLNNTSGSTDNFQVQIDNLQAQIDNSILPRVFPVGSIYTSISSIDPATTFGFGTWEQYAQGRVLVGVDNVDSDFNPAEKTGGSKNATLPLHSHSGTVEADGDHKHFTASDVFDDDTDPNFGEVNQFRHSHRSVRDTGGDDNFRYRLFGSPTPDPTVAPTDNAGDHTHNLLIGGEGDDPIGANMPPYISVYFWLRTA